MRDQLIVDVETTGLDPERHEIWELAIIERGTGAEHLWRFQPDLPNADPGALAVGQFYERTAEMRTHPDRSLTCDLAALKMPAGYWSNPARVAGIIAPMLAGATINAAVPSFDATKFLAAFLARYGHCREPWNYRLRDIGSMSYGYLQACIRLGIEGRDAALGCPDMDAGTDDFARSLGVDPAAFGRHEALGDCRLVAAMLAVIEGGS